MEQLWGTNGTSLLPSFCADLISLSHCYIGPSLVNLSCQCPPVTEAADGPRHRRRIKTEEKAEVIAAVWGTDLIPFLAALTILHQDDLKKEVNSSYSSYCHGAIHLHIVLVQFILFFISSWCNSSYSSNHPGTKQLAWQGIKSILSTKQQRRPLPSLLSLSLLHYNC